MKHGVVFLLLLVAASMASAFPCLGQPSASLPITSIDTMKESRDSDRNPLSTAQIQNDIAVSSQLHSTYITVDTFYDYPQYMQRWVRAIRTAHKHIWFRCCFNAWEGNNSVPATMTPRQYTTALTAFIAAHPGFFQGGDILDPLPEPENGKCCTYPVQCAAVQSPCSFSSRALIASTIALPILTSPGSRVNPPLTTCVAKCNLANQCPQRCRAFLLML